MNVAEEGNEEDPDEGEAEGEQEEGGDQEEEYDEEEFAELTEQLEALTVTSEKLKALTLGRKFYGSKGGSKGGKSSSQDLSTKKQNTKCSVCHQFGHWHKDPQCPGPPKSKGGAPKGKAPSKVRIAEEVDPSEEHESFFVYAVNVARKEERIYQTPTVLLASATTSAGYMIIDTACQRLCHGKSWRSNHDSWLKKYGLSTNTAPCQEKFRFGAGSPQESSQKVILPCELEGHQFALHSCELEAAIPLLGSLSLLTWLGAVIDLGQDCVKFTRFGVTAPLARLDNGHIAVKMLPAVEAWEGKYPSEFHQWEQSTEEVALPSVQIKPTSREHYGSAGKHTSQPVYHELCTESEKVSCRDTKYGIEDEYEFDRSRFGSQSTVPAAFKAWNAARDVSATAEPRSLEANSTRSHELDVRSVQGRSEGREAEMLFSSFTDTIPGVVRTALCPTRRIPGGTPDAVDSTTNKQVQPRRSNEVREPLRKVRGVQESRMPSQNEIRRGRGSLAGVLLTLATAVAASLNGTDSSGTKAEEWLWDEHIIQGTTNAQAQAGTEQNSKSTTGIRYPLLRERDDVGRRRGNVSVGGRRGTLQLKEGEKKRLSSQASRSASLLSAEKETMDNELLAARSRRQRTPFGTDLLEMPCSLPQEALVARLKHYEHNENQPHFAEMFAGQAKPTRWANKYGLRAAEPAEKLNGWDLSQPKQARLWKENIKQQKPLVVVIQYPCRYWARLVNTNFAHRPEVLEELRKGEENIFNLMLWTIREQTKNGRFWILENPQGSELWKHPRVMQEMHMAGATTVVSESGAFGGTNSRGDKILKRYVFAGNHEWLLEP